MEIAKLLIKAGADIDAQNNYNSTALIRAAWLGVTDTAKFLIAAGAKIDVRNEGGDTALMEAA